MVICSESQTIHTESGLKNVEKILEMGDSGKFYFIMRTRISGKEAQRIYDSMVGFSKKGMENCKEGGWRNDK